MKQTEFLLGASFQFSSDLRKPYYYITLFLTVIYRLCNTPNPPRKQF